MKSLCPKIRRIKNRLGLKTHWIEKFFVASILVAVNIIFEKPAVEWVAFLAIMFAFGKTQIGFRLSEKQGDKKEEKPDVPCYKWYNRLYIAAEITFAIYFILIGAHPLLIGALVFMTYPHWRKFWNENKEEAVLIKE